MRINFAWYSAASTAVLLLSCNQEAGTTHAKSRFEAAKALVFGGASNDRIALEKTYLPQECLLEMFARLGKQPPEDLDAKLAIRRDDLVKKILEVFGGKQCASATFEDFGLSKFSDGEKAEIGVSATPEIDEHGDVAITLGELKHSFRLVRYKGQFYFVDFK